jgi:uncharacterized membrane protein YfcA
MDLVPTTLLYSLSGLFVGMLVGMTGVGGGSLMTPLLIVLFGIRPEVAVGTDLLYAALTKTAGTAVHGMAQSIEWRIVRRLAMGSMPGTILAIIGLYVAGELGGAGRAVITSVLGVALSLTVLSLLFRKTIERLALTRLPERSDETVRRLTIATGFVLGVTVAISSVGAGALGVTALILLYPRLPIVKIVGSDIAHAVPLTLTAGIGHWLLGGVDWTLFWALLGGSVPGIVAGSYIANRVPEDALRFLLAAVLTVVAARLFAG